MQLANANKSRPKYSKLAMDKLMYITYSIKDIISTAKTKGLV